MDFPETLATDAEGNCLIATADELLDFSTYVNTKKDDCTNMTFKLVNDIDLGSVGNFTPIGGDTFRFSGTFDGDGHTIKNLKISTTEDYQGLFGCVGSSGKIQNVKLEKVKIEIYGSPRKPHWIDGEKGAQYPMNAVGGLVGYNFGKIFNCSVDGSVKGLRPCVGGIVGYNNYGGTVRECFFSGSVKTPMASLGGIAGLNENSGKIENCKVNCYLYGYFKAGRVGGIVGSNYKSIVSNCYAVIKYTSTKYESGGIVGFNRLGSSASGYFYDESGNRLYGVGGGKGTDNTEKLYKLLLPNSITATSDYSVEICGETYYFEKDFLRIDELIDDEINYATTVVLTGALATDDKIKILDTGSDAYLKLNDKIVTVDRLTVRLENISLPADEFVWTDVENNSATYKKFSYRVTLSNDNRAIICAADEKILFTLGGISSTDDITIDDNVVTVPKENRVANVTIDGDDYELAPDEIEPPTVDDDTERAVDDDAERAVDDDAEFAANDKLYEIFLPNGITVISGASEIDGKIYCNKDATVVLTGALATDDEIKILDAGRDAHLELKGDTVTVGKLTVLLENISLPADEFVWTDVENNSATYKKISYRVTLSNDNRAIICAADEKILFTLGGISSTNDITIDADNVITVPKENRVADIRINGYKLADSPAADTNEKPQIIDTPTASDTPDVVAQPVTANDTKEITVNIAIKISAQGLKISGDAVTSTLEK